MQPEVEGEAELPAGEAPAEAETGANKYMYYVCTSLGGPFTLLGDVTPAQIKVARQLKKLLIGDLAAPVATYPPFPGSERHYLRAQIARIAHSTVLCPKGLYTAPEDGAGDPEPNEEYAAAPVSRMLDPASWCHWCAPCHCATATQISCWQPKAWHHICMHMRAFSVYVPVTFFSHACS